MIVVSLALGTLAELSFWSSATDRTSARPDETIISARPNDRPGLKGSYSGQKPPATTPETSAPGKGSLNADLRLFIMGGFKEKEAYAEVHSIHILDLISGVSAPWDREAPLPERLQGHTAAAAYGYIFRHRRA